MKPSNFIPLYFPPSEYGRVFISLDKPDTGGFDTSSIDAATYIAQVLSVTSDIKQLKKGDRVLVLPNHCDIMNVEGLKIYSILTDSQGITHKFK